MEIWLFYESCAHPAGRGIDWPDTLLYDGTISLVNAGLEKELAAIPLLSDLPPGVMPGLQPIPNASNTPRPHPASRR